MHLKARYEFSESVKEYLYGYESMDGFCYKLVTVLSLICRDRKRYCFCEKYESLLNLVCPLCYIPMYFYNFREDLHLNCTDPVFLACYRDRLSPFLIECFIIKESSIVAFAGRFFTIYDDDGNIPKNVSVIDLSLIVRKM